MFQILKQLPTNENLVDLKQHPMCQKRHMRSNSGRYSKNFFLIFLISWYIRKHDKEG